MMMMRMVVMMMGPTNRSISGQALICSNNRHLSFSQPGVIIIINNNNKNMTIVTISIITIIFILIMRNLLTVPPPTKVAPQPVIVGEGFDKSAVRFL